MHITLINASNINNKNNYTTLSDCISHA